MVITVIPKTIKQLSKVLHCAITSIPFMRRIGSGDRCAPASKGLLLVFELPDDVLVEMHAPGPTCKGSNACPGENISDSIMRIAYSVRHNTGVFFCHTEHMFIDLYVVLCPARLI